jgi:hypothetical protein
MPRTTTWKHAERKLAAYVGGERAPINGRGNAPDIEHPWLSIECKHRQTVPGWIKSALRQAELGNVTGDKLPVALIHEAGSRYEESLVVLKLSDFRAWFGDR